MKKVALITGISGQLGRWLVPELFKRGYEIHGFCRRGAEYLLPTGGGKVCVHRVDITDEHAIQLLLTKIKPTHVFHLAALSVVHTSFDNAQTVYETNIGGTLNILNAMMLSCPEARIFHPASSECFGDAKVSPQDENTPFNPRNPYGVSKAAAYWTMKNYRKTYGLFAVNGIMFNMDSSFRSTEFLSKKLTKSVAEIAAGKRGEVVLGNIDCYRDVMFAGDAARGMVDAMEYSTPHDFVFATGKFTAIREICEIAFRKAGIPITWGFDSDKGVSNHLTEVGRRKNGEIVVRISKDFYRPTEEHILVGNSAKAEKLLGWKPNTTVTQLIENMVAYEMGQLSGEGNKPEGRETHYFKLGEKLCVQQ